MKGFFKQLGDALGTVLTILCILIFCVTCVSFLHAKQTNEPVTIFGYRPVYVLTGSMEPCMMTDSLVITKAVKDGDELSEGDIVTYHIENDEGKTLVITHRIKELNEDGTYTTKGDNNRVADAYSVPRENIEAKVVLCLNWVATLIHMWATTKGRIIILLAAGAVVFLYISLKLLFGAPEPEKAPNATPRRK